MHYIDARNYETATLQNIYLQILQLNWYTGSFNALSNIALKMGDYYVLLYR